MKYKGSCHCGKVAFEHPKGNRMAAINIRCLEAIDLEGVPVQHFDGRSL